MMIHNQNSELRRLASVLKSIGLAKDYPRVREEADWLNYYATSIQPTPLERRRGAIERLEKLPALLKNLRDRARLESKRKRYDSIIATLEYGFPELLNLWRYWDKSKDEVYSILDDITLWARAVRQWEIVEETTANSILFFPEINNAMDEKTPEGRFGLKLQELLPKPRIEPEDYQELIGELEACLEAWNAVNMTSENKLKLQEINKKVEEHIAQLHVSSLMDI